MDLMRFFIGFDFRQPVSYQVLHHSLLRRTSEPIAIVPLDMRTLPLSRSGLTPFTFSRYLVPWLCGYEGQAVFLDSDMLYVGDPAEMWEEGRKLLQFGASVAVRPLKDELKYERAASMVFNCSACRELTPETLDNPKFVPQTFEWATGGIAPLPARFNRLVGYEDCADAHVLHYTAGVPAFQQVRGLGYCEPWDEEFNASVSIARFEQLMGNSRHVGDLGLKTAEPLDEATPPEHEPERAD